MPCDKLFSLVYEVFLYKQPRALFYKKQPQALKPAVKNDGEKMAVKGSKQHRMKVIPHRPWQQRIKYLLLVVVAVGLCGLVYWFDVNEGFTRNVERVAEQDNPGQRLRDSGQADHQAQQDCVNLKVGGEIDNKVNEAARQTIKSLQEQIGKLNEEISFYKIMLQPSVTNEGLRIEQFDITPEAFGGVRYSLLLTQVMEKHDYVQGDLKISLVGRDAGQKKQLSLGELDNGKEATMPFRFKYFQSINGKLTLPDGFEPMEVMVVAESSGANAQRLERKFDWSLSGG